MTIGRASRRTAGPFPAVLSIGLLLLLSACTHYGPMNRNLVSLDPAPGPDATALAPRW